MATLNENINAIKEVKENIKNALIAKNVDMAGVAFTGYPQKIEGLSFELLFNACKTRNGDQATPITITIEATRPAPSRFKGARIVVAAIGMEVLRPIMIDIMFSTVLLSSL